MKLKITICLPALFLLIISQNLIPFPKSWLAGSQPTSLLITDRHGDALREVRGRHQSVNLAEISPNVIAMTLFIEDRRFFSHPGIDLLAVARAVKINLEQGHIVQGASTITQQVARTLFPGPRNILQKLMETGLAFWLEASLTKSEILSLYLNNAPFGNGYYGIRSASENYFNKSAGQLSMKEAAYLIGLLKAPSRYNPYRQNQRALDRAHLLLANLADLQSWSLEKRKSMAEEVITLFPPTQPFQAPHFSEYVLENMPARVTNKIQTTLDLALQNDAEQIIREELSALSDRKVNNASVLIVNTKTGEILSWIGSANYWNRAIDGMVDGVLASRQPGSALKPFTYVLALNQGWSPATVLPDVSHSYRTERGAYQPANYDHLFHGPVSLRQALGSSLNVPAVHTLNHIGVEHLHHFLQQLGFSTLNEAPAHYGLGLTLGNADVRLFDLVQAYTIFGNDGMLRQLRWLSNDVIAESRPLSLEGRGPGRGWPGALISKETAFLIQDILTDNQARQLAFGEEGPLKFDYPVLVKTGTSTNYRDNWAIGLTPEITVGVWVGKFNGEPMQGISGVTGAAPIMHRLVERALAGKIPDWTDPPASLKKISYCSLSGQPAHNLCPHQILDWAQTEPSKLCDWHEDVPIDTRNGLRAGNTCDESYVTRKSLIDWPPIFQAWSAHAGYQSMPAFSPLCTKNNSAMKILAPNNGDVYRLQAHIPKKYQTITFRAHAEASQVEWKLNKQWLGSGQELPWSLAKGTYILQADNGESEAEINFRVE